GARRDAGSGERGPLRAGARRGMTIDDAKEPAMTERLISADSHVSVSHDQVKAQLPRKWHRAYDEAQHAFAARMDANGAGRANTAAMRENPHAAFTRPGYRDGHERLKDMDVD